jgi:Zinc-ribbon
LQEDIHTSRIPSQIPPCNHLIHKTCFDEMLAAGHYACPLCGISMIPMSDIWRMYDREIAESPMPEEYANLYAGIQCRDCLKASIVPFHLMGKFSRYFFMDLKKIPATVCKSNNREILLYR